MRLHWQSFLDTTQDDQEIKSFNQVITAATTNVQDDLTGHTIQQLYHTPELKKLYAKFKEFNELTSKMGKFWLSYIEMVSLLLRFVHSTREGDWNLHLACIRDMIPWMFAYGRINYSRYLLLYWCEMMLLAEKHPVALEAFQAGEFAAQRSTGSFTQVAVDQTIEQTINRDTKSKGGIIGFSVNKGAVQRWLLTSHERAATTQACREIAGISMTDGDKMVKEMGKARMAVDERDVKNVQSTLSSWVNPFIQSDDEEISQLASGLTTSKKDRKRPSDSI